MSTPINDILSAANEYLDTSAYTDYGPIGLQVSSRTTTATNITTSVSSTLASLSESVALGSNLHLTHHGLFWRNTSQVIDPIMRERIAMLIENEVALAGYHLPLDGHPVIGNNALICDALGLERQAERFAIAGGNQIGCIGEFAGTGVPFDELVERIESVMEDRAPLMLGATPKHVKRVGVCSGGGADFVSEAAAHNCDLFITGEPAELTHALATELGISFAAAGHHATERFGIRALGEFLAKKFELDHTFIDADNPV